MKFTTLASILALTSLMAIFIAAGEKREGQFGDADDYLDMFTCINLNKPDLMAKSVSGQDLDYLKGVKKFKMEGLKNKCRETIIPGIEMEMAAVRGIPPERIDKFVYRDETADHIFEVAISEGMTFFTIRIKKRTPMNSEDEAVRLYETWLRKIFKSEKVAQFEKDVAESDGFWWIRNIMYDEDGRTRHWAPWNWPESLECIVDHNGSIITIFLRNGLNLEGDHPAKSALLPSGEGWFDRIIDRLKKAKQNEAGQN